MAIYNVFLDTCVFINAKYDFGRASLFNLKKYCEDGIVTEFSNDIIIREVNHHIDSDVGLLAKQAKNAIKKHGELKNALTLPVYEEIKNKLDNATRQLIDAFDKYMESAILLSNDAVSVVELLNDYFTSNAPFEKRKEKKSEFPDAIIIMSIKQYITSHEDSTLHVVTDDNGWHNALKGTGNVVLHKDIKSFLTLISKDQPLFYRIVDFVNEKIEVLEKQTIDWLADQDWYFTVDEAEMCIECDEINEVNVTNISLSLNGIEYIDKTKGYAVAALNGTSTIDIGYSYIDHTNEIYDKEEHVWYNTAYGDGTSKIEVPISLSITVLLPDSEDMELDIDAPDFDELDENSIRTIEYELMERYDEIHEPYYNICPDCGCQIGHHNDGGNGFCMKCASEH